MSTDWIREILITAFVFVLLVKGYRLRSPTITIISLTTLCQHTIQWPENSPAPNGFLTNWLIKVGATILAISGLYYASVLVTFAGTYSLLSKFSYYWLVGGRISDGIHEIVKGVVAVVVTIILLICRMVGVKWYLLMHPKTENVCTNSTSFISKSDTLLSPSCAIKSMESTTKNSQQRVRV
jgi:hypothetical protein